MQFIFPAADAAVELQESLHSYLKAFDNPLIKKSAVVLTEKNHHNLAIAHLNGLLGYLKYYKFAIARMSEQLVQADPQFQEKKKAISALWDLAEKVRTFSDSDITHLTLEQIKIYTPHLFEVVSELNKNLRVPHTVKRMIGPCPTTPVVDIAAVPTFRLRDCQILIKAIVQDEMDIQMRWRKADANDQSNIEMALLQLFPEWDGINDSLVANMGPEYHAIWRDQCEQCSTHFFHKVMEPAMRKISHWVHSTIPYRTWEVWYLKPLKNDLVLEKGEDFRVMDWERRMKSGEWKDEIADTLAAPEVATKEFKELNEYDITATTARYESEMAAGFSPRLFTARLGDRPVKAIFEAGKFEDRLSNDNIAKLVIRTPKGKSRG